MADDSKLPRPLPRLRVTSHSFADVSSNKSSNVTQRTVSSSTSIISTPSNNIRRVQQRQAINARKNPGDFRVSGVSSNATKKLLNFQQLKKTITRPKAFVLRKPINMSKYDYTVFTRHGPEVSEDLAENDPLPPPIKESQIRAWESAEKISANIIFDHERSKEGFALDAKDLDDSYDAGDGETSIDRGKEGLPNEEKDNIVTAIPGYTKGELQIVLDNYEKMQWSDHVDIDQVIEDEHKALWVHRQQQSAAQERAFVACHTLSGKRKVQVFHKKEFLHKLFGYSNNVNHEYITNNTSYSAFDNVLNAQKAFHEDKEEICSLLEEEKAFEEALADTKERLQSSATQEPKACEQEMDHSNLLDLTSSWLSSAYDRQVSLSEDSMQPDEVEDPEMVTCTLSYLKQCVRDATEKAPEE